MLKKQWKWLKQKDRAILLHVLILSRSLDYSSAALQNPRGPQIILLHPINALRRGSHARLKRRPARVGRHIRGMDRAKGWLVGYGRDEGLESRKGVDARLFPGLSNRGERINGDVGL